MSVIDEAAALEATGENRLEGIRQLIMRGKKLAFFERSCAIRLRSLTVSHARVDDFRTCSSLWWKDTPSASRRIAVKIWGITFCVSNKSRLDHNTAHFFGTVCLIEWF